MPREGCGENEVREVYCEKILGTLCKRGPVEAVRGRGKRQQRERRMVKINAREGGIKGTSEKEGERREGGEPRMERRGTEERRGERCGKRI